ncbi:MAG: acyltransferase, partial [Acidobacteriaceae bacterium]
MSQRQTQIDLMKGLLVVAMIWGHVGMMLGKPDSYAWDAFFFVAAAGVFSGFFFCYGFAVWWSYFNRPVFPRQRMLSAALKCYAAYLISGCAYRILLQGQKPDVHLLLTAGLLVRIPEMSEFLLAFALIILIAALFPAMIRLATRSPRSFAAFSLVCLALTRLHVPSAWPPIVGLFLSQPKSDCFPVILYLPLFLMGAFVARHRLPYNRVAAMIAGAVFVMFCVAGVMRHRYVTPDRFPPNAVWIIGSAAIVYLFLGIGIAARRLPRIAQNYLNATGQSVLYYLVLSNLLIFALAALGYAYRLNVLDRNLTFLFLMAVLLFLQSIVVDYKHATKAAMEEPERSMPGMRRPPERVPAGAMPSGEE